MARLRLYLNCLNGWEEVAAAAEAHEGEMPHIDVARPELLDLIEQARSLVVQLNSFTASKQNARKQLLEVLRLGQGMVDVIRTAVRQRYGPHSEILVEFGMQPLRGRPQGSEPEIPTPETPESPSPTPTPE